MLEFLTHLAQIGVSVFAGTVPLILYLAASRRKGTDNVSEKITELSEGQAVIKTEVAQLRGVVSELKESIKHIETILAKLPLTFITKDDCERLRSLTNGK